MDVFEALADPVRREILDILRRGESEAGAIAARFAISRPAISRHLRVLREAGLVTARLDGRNRIYALRTSPLTEVDRWLAPYRDALGPAEIKAMPPQSRTIVCDGQTWEARIDALETEVFRTRRDRRAAEASSPEPTTTTAPHEEEQSA